MQQSIGVLADPRQSTTVSAAGDLGDADVIAQIREQIVAAIRLRPRRLVVDFAPTAGAGETAGDLLAEAAARCRAARVEFEVTPSRYLDLLAERLEIAPKDWLGHARRIAADNPLRLSETGLAGAVGGMTIAQLDAARAACWREYHRAVTGANRRASQRRLKLVLAELLARGAGPSQHARHPARGLPGA